VIVVCNATPLIALAKINRLTLLPELFGAILIPQAVYSEVVILPPDRPGAAEIQQAEWIHARAVTDRIKVDYLRADLDPGEAEALVLAEEIAADWILLDEPKARLAAELLGLKFIGTIGLLLLAKRIGKIKAVRPLLDELKANKFHLSEKVYRATLKQAGE
jgi:predicted nucleic acid-binding protein